MDARVEEISRRYFKPKRVILEFDVREEYLLFRDIMRRNVGVPKLMEKNDGNGKRRSATLTLINGIERACQEQEIASDSD